jgi:4-diphosphocytidyl-2-C-methyl-D-erythritol kinase
VYRTSIPSFAKINWHLSVLKKRPDRYHELVTVFQTISLHDEMRFVRRDDDRVVLRCTDPVIPTDKRNLIIRAADALRDRAQGSMGVDVELTKRIPSQAGLGGASSNAAVALRAFAKLWDIPSQDLLTIATGLGADVPFFLVGGRALGRGIGADVSPLPDEETVYLIVLSPNAKVRTASAYNALDARTLTSQDTDPILASSSAEPNSDDWCHWPLHNDFESVIFDIEPEVERAKVALLDSGARAALLAGSGSSVFGIFASEAARQRALECLNCEAGWRVFPCETLSREEYVREMDVQLKFLH